MPKKNLKVNTKISPDSRINTGAATGTFHSEQINNVFALNKRAIETLKVKYPQYTFENGDIEESYARNLLGSSYQNLKLEDLLPIYNEDQHTINTTLSNVSRLYGFLDNDTLSRIIADGKAKEVLETFTREICENERLLDMASPDEDVTKGYLANKAIANMLRNPGLYADVDEVTLTEPDGSKKKGLLVWDDNLNQHIENTQKGGESLQSKKALLDMQVFTLLTGQVTPNESSFTYTFDNEGNMSGLQMKGLGSEGSFVDNEELISDKRSLPLMTKSMFDSLSRLDVNTFRENLAKTGLNKDQLENAVTNFLAMKEKITHNVMIGNKGIYTKYNEDDGLVIVDDKVLEDLDLDEYPKLGFMKDYFEDTFNNNYIREREQMYQKPEAMAEHEYSMDEETKAIANSIINHKRTFGFITLSNSDSYQRIVDALNDFDEKGNPEDLIRLCNEYEQSHINPRTSDGATRLRNISELKNKLELGVVDNKLSNIENKLNVTENVFDGESLKREEIAATYQKIQLLAKTHPEIDMECINNFYDSVETRTAPDILSDPNGVDQAKDAAARIIMHSLIKDELEKEEPDFSFINSLTENTRGALRSIVRSNALNDIVTTDDKSFSVNEDVILVSSASIVENAKENSPTLNSPSALITNAKVYQGNIEEEERQALEEANERKRIGEKMNMEEVIKEQEAEIERNLKDQKYYDKNPVYKKAGDLNRKITETNMAKYKKMTGTDYQPHKDGDEGPSFH